MTFITAQKLFDLIQNEEICDVYYLKPGTDKYQMLDEAVLLEELDRTFEVDIPAFIDDSVDLIFPDLSWMDNQNNAIL